MDSQQRRAGTFAYDLVDGILVMTHGKTNPTEQEWDDHLVEVRAWKDKLRGTVVYTVGGGPDGSQRRKLFAVWGKGEPIPPCALLTTSAAATSLGSVISFFLKNKVRMLRPTQIEDAVRFIKMPDTFVPKLRAILQEQARGLSLPLPTLGEASAAPPPR